MVLLILVLFSSTISYGQKGIQNIVIKSSLWSVIFKVLCLVFKSDMKAFFLNRYRTVFRLRAMRIFAPEFISKTEELSGKKRGAKCPRGGTRSWGELFFLDLRRLKPLLTHRHPMSFFHSTWFNLKAS